MRGGERRHLKAKDSAYQENLHSACFDNSWMWDVMGAPVHKPWPAKRSSRLSQCLLQHRQSRQDDTICESQHTTPHSHSHVQRSRGHLEVMFDHCAGAGLRLREATGAAPVGHVVLAAESAACTLARLARPLFGCGAGRSAVVRHACYGAQQHVYRKSRSAACE